MEDGISTLPYGHYAITSEEIAVEGDIPNRSTQINSEGEVSDGEAASSTGQSIETANEAEQTLEEEEQDFSDDE